MRNAYDKIVRRHFGFDLWSLDSSNRNGALGMLIVKSILDGVDPILEEVAYHLEIKPEILQRPFYNLSLNGIFLYDRLERDREELEIGNKTAWCYYAGYASGDIGNVIYASQER